MHRLLLCIAAAVAFSVPAHSQPYLSSLSVQAGDPLYTYYASPPHRTNLLIDHAYKLIYDVPDRGISFETERAEIIGFAVRLGQDVRYFTREMARPPMISHSYSDIVRFSFEPFIGVDVRATFAAYTSTVAVLDLEVENQTGGAITIDVFPFFYAKSGLTDITATPDGITFGRAQPRHPVADAFGIPPGDTLYNFFRLDEPAQAFGAYAALGPYEDRPTGLSAAAMENAAARDHPAENMQGQIFLEDGSLCTSESASLEIFYGGRMITDAASTTMLPGNGSYSVHVRYLPETGEMLLRAVCDGEQGEVWTSTDATGADIHLAADKFVPPPEKLEANTTTDYRTVFLLWESDGAAGFDVFRAPPSRPWKFDQIADSIGAASYFDSPVEPDSAYRYVVLAVDSSGRRSRRSSVVRKDVPPPPPEPAPSFFDEVYEDQLSGRVHEGPLHVAAFQRNLQLDPGESKAVRVKREMYTDPAQGPHDHWLSTGLDEILRESEDAFAGVYEGRERPLLYWSAMNLVRQSIVKHLDGTYVVDRRGAIDPRKGMLQEPSNLLAAPLVAGFDTVLAREILETVADLETDGFIPYWTGPYISSTASATDLAFPPIFARAAAHRVFPGSSSEMPQSVVDAADAVYHFWKQSDQDADGLSEWRHPIESMRPGSVIWRVFEPSELEAYDLNVHLADEATSLAELEARPRDYWMTEVEERSARIQETFWDEESGFFYHALRPSNAISEDLKRPEVISFMPDLSTTTVDQRGTLGGHIENPDLFNRPYGLPSLSAADSAYQSSGTWDGPVHPMWQLYAVKLFGRADLREGLWEAIESSLAEHHDFFELYSPDHLWGGHQAGGVENGWVAGSMYAPPVDTELQPEAITAAATAYPNPFDEMLRLAFSLPATADVRITLHDLLGRRVGILVDERRGPGRYEVEWRPADLASGVYFYRIESGDRVETGSATYLGGR